MKLKEICEINPKTREIDDDTEVSFVPMSSVSEDGKIDTSDIRSYQDVKKGYTVFQEGDVLFAKITPCMENGKGAIAYGLMNGKGCGSSEFHVLRPNKDVATAEWIYYLTAWEWFRNEAEKHMTGSAGQKRVPKAYLENYVVNVPSLEEQKKQTKVLVQLQQIIDDRKKELICLDDLIKARFVELFESSELSDETTIEAVTEQVKVGFVGTCEKYYTDESGVPMLRTGNITEKGIDLKDLKYVTREFHEKNKKSQIHTGDLLIARHGSNGQANVYSGPEAQCLNAVVIVPNQSIASSIFLAGLLNAPMVKEQIERTLVGSTQRVVNTKSIANLKVRVPSTVVQRQYEEFVKQTDKSKVAVQKALEETQILFDSLMQDYFG